MEFKVAQSENAKLKQKVRFFTLFSVALVVANMLLVMLVFAAMGHQRRTIVPMGFHKSFTVTDGAVDSSYLEQMSVAFCQERLNVTPDDVQYKHNLVLQYCDPDFYHDFVKILNQEKQNIVKENISSVFYISSVKPDLDDLSVQITGTLKRWVGDVALDPVKKTFEIKFNYSDSVLTVKSFSELEQDNS